MRNIRYQSRLTISHVPSSSSETFLVSQLHRVQLYQSFMPIVALTYTMPPTKALMTQQSNAHPTTGVSPQGHKDQSHSYVIHPGKTIQAQKTRCCSVDGSSLRSVFIRAIGISRRKEFRATIAPLDDCVATIRNKMGAKSNASLSVNEVQDLLISVSKDGMATTGTALYKEWDTFSTVHDEAMSDTTSLLQSDRTLSSLNVYRSVMEIQRISDTKWEGAQYRPWDTVPLMAVCDPWHRI